MRVYCKTLASSDNCDFNNCTTKPYKLSNIMQSSTLLTFMYCVGSSPGSIPITLCTGQHVSLTVLLFTIYFGIYLCSNTSQLNLLQQVLYSNIKHMSLKLVTKESIFSHSLGSSLVCNNPYRSRHTLFLTDNETIHATVPEHKTANKLILYQASQNLNHFQKIMFCDKICKLIVLLH